MILLYMVLILIDTCLDTFLKVCFRYKFSSSLSRLHWVCLEQIHLPSNNVKIVQVDQSLVLLHCPDHCMSGTLYQTLQLERLATRETYWSSTQFWDRFLLCFPVLTNEVEHKVYFPYDHSSIVMDVKWSIVLILEVSKHQKFSSMLCLIPSTLSIFWLS